MRAFIVGLLFLLFCLAVACYGSMGMRLDLGLAGGRTISPPPSSTSSSITIGGAPVTIGGAAVKIQE